MRFVLMCVATLFAMNALAATPYPPEINARFNKLEAKADTDSPVTNGLQKMKVARVAFDGATMGASGTNTSLGVTLPANALLWDGVIYTSSTMGGSGSIALTCEDAGNIKAVTTASTFSTTGTKTALAMTGTAASAVSSIAAACPITANVTLGPVTGKFDAWIEYFVTD